MSTTLKQRINERMAALGITNAQLAKMAKVKPPTSYHWASGKTQSIKGEPLLLAAKALGVTPEWLATGRGPRDASDVRPVSIAYTQETAQAFGNPWPFELVSQARYESLTPAQKHQAQVRMMDEIEKLEVKTKRLTGT